MRTTSPFNKIVERFYFVELLACTIYLGYIGFFNSGLINYYLLLGTAILALVAFIANIVLQNRTIFNVISITLLALSIGLLSFNYLPSVSLWLLLFYRLMVIPKKTSASLMLLACVIIGFTLFTVYTYFPPATLPPTAQNILNHVSLLLTAVFFGYYLWQLLLKLQQSRRELQLSQARVQTLVEVTSKLSRFTPPQIWQPIIRQNQALTVTNQRKKLTILFSDIVGFTELSDNLSPDHLADILNTYFGRMTTIANQYGATLDKFIGDGMLCFFGDDAQNNERNHAIQCASMALAMRHAMRELRSQWRLLGFEGLYMRIGINTGYCHVGNFGSPERISYTLIGKAANLASRLESAAEKDQILLSEATFLLINTHHHCRPAGHYQLKGLSEPIPVWQLLEEKDASKPLTNINHHQQGFNLQMDITQIKVENVDSIKKMLTQTLENLEKI